jgi:hypothetical protein
VLERMVAIGEGEIGSLRERKIRDAVAIAGG